MTEENIAALAFIASVENNEDWNPYNDLKQAYQCLDALDIAYTIEDSGERNRDFDSPCYKLVIAGEDVPCKMDLVEQICAKVIEISENG